MVQWQYWLADVSCKPYQWSHDLLTVSVDDIIMGIPHSKSNMASHESWHLFSYSLIYICCWQVRGTVTFSNNARSQWILLQSDLKQTANDLQSVCRLNDWETTERHACLSFVWSIKSADGIDWVHRSDNSQTVCRVFEVINHSGFNHSGSDPSVIWERDCTGAPFKVFLPVTGGEKYLVCCPSTCRLWKNIA